MDSGKFIRQLNYNSQYSSINTRTAFQKEIPVDDYDISSYNSQVVDCEIEGWHVCEYINHGKSAAVYKAQKNDLFSAIKVFDRNIVKKYGLENQRERVEREKSLIGKHHKSLIDIYGGGYFKPIDLLYVIMQYLNIGEVIPSQLL